MSGSKPDRPPFSADAFGETDFARVDAHEIAPEEYEELPELTDAMVARADHHIGDRLVSRGTSSDQGEAVSIPLSPAVLAYFRAGGPGWQRRIDEVLLEAVRREGGKT